MEDKYNMKRFLYRGNKQCPFGCAYCFAILEQYKPQPAFIQFAESLSGVNVVYPSCDSELTLQPDYLSTLSTYIKSLRTPTIISFSTKSSIKASDLESLCELNRFMNNNELGFVKVGVSISTKDFVSIYEPNTPPYETRLTTLRSLMDTGIPYSLTLKPILPFIESNEYFEIIRDCKDIVSKVLIGGLYVDPSSNFYKTHIYNKYQHTLRAVTWLDNEPQWPYILEDDKADAIRDYALRHGMMLYDSDLDLLQDMARDKGLLV